MEKYLDICDGVWQKHTYEDGPTCKKKRITIHGNYKRIQDYMVGIGHSEDH